MNKELIVSKSHDLKDLNARTNIKDIFPGDTATLPDGKLYRVINCYWESRKSYSIIFELVTDI